MKPIDSELNIGKLLPSDIPVEEQVIGSILSEAGLFHSVSTILSPATFYRSEHVRIWKTIEKLAELSVPIDGVSVVSALKKSGELDAVGGPFYVAQLGTKSGGLAYIEHHALHLKELYLKRELIKIQSKSVSNLYEDGTDVFDEMANVQVEMERLVMEINKIQTNQFADEVVTTVEELKESAQNENHVTGVLSFIEPLDRYTSGFQNTDLIIVAARPAVGKTALVMDMARKQAQHGIPVGVFSLEMNTRQLVMRMLASETDINLKKIRKANMNTEQWKAIDKAGLQLMDYPFVINDKGGLNINDLCATAKIWKLKFGIKILYVDYLQRIFVTGNKNWSREQDVTFIAERLKTLAKTLNIPVVALSQLTREVEKRKPPIPILSDLRESGGIEQAADIVIFPYRPILHDNTAQEDLCELIIAKYRNDETGKVKIKFVGAYQRFEDYEAFKSKDEIKFEQPKDLPF